MSKEDELIEHLPRLHDRILLGRNGLGPQDRAARAQRFPLCIVVVEPVTGGESDLEIRLLDVTTAARALTRDAVVAGLLTLDVDGTLTEVPLDEHLGEVLLTDTRREHEVHEEVKRVDELAEVRLGVDVS